MGLLTCPGLPNRKVTKSWTPTPLEVSWELSPPRWVKTPEQNEMSRGPCWLLGREEVMDRTTSRAS